MRRLFTSILLLVVTATTIASAQETTPLYKDPSQSVDLRVKDLLSRMTLEEKFWQLYMIPGDIYENKENYKHGIFGFQTDTKGSSGNVAEQLLDYSSSSSSAKETAIKINDMQRFFMEETRLGIPMMPFDEALHGLIREGATSFPIPMAMAASWNEPLMRESSAVMATETLSRGIRDVLSPVVNLATDPRWGRTEESYGEDPYLSSRMGVAFVSEFEKRGVITTPKHYIANLADGGRDSYPVYYSEHYIRETHLVPFEACFSEGGSRSVMSAYNSIDGQSCTANSIWLRDVLKGDLSFDGFVVSDAGAAGGANVLHFTSGSYPESTKHAIEGGLDVFLQSSYVHYPLFYDAFQNNMIDPAAIDEAVSRVLRAKFELGLFENPYVDIDKVDELNHSKENIEVARRMAIESFVLLTNQNNTLPLKSDTKSIALIGYDMAAARQGGYSGPATGKVSILDGFKEIAGSDVTINHAEGVALEHSDYVTVPSSSLSTTLDGKKSEGLLGKYYSNPDFEGDPTIERIDKQLSFGWTLYSPEDGVIPYDSYSVVWQGKITSQESGTFNIGLNGNDGYRLYIDGRLIVDNFKKVSFNRVTAPFAFEKDKEYDIKVEYYETVGNVRLSLVWDAGVDHDLWKRQIAQAKEAAEKSDIAIVSLGMKEGEGNDRAYLWAQGKQLEMLDAVIETGKPVVVLIVGGSAMTMEGWRDRVSAIVDIWYPGEQGGYAVAEVLMGRYSPSGKLPITFPIDEAQLPLVYNHKPTGRIDDYNNLSGQPLFPFGYGLSYTTFDYSDMVISRKEIGKNESVTVSCKITNSGAYEAKEVVQLYIRDCIASISQPLIALKDFKKISLKPGQSSTVEFTITPKHLKMLNEHMKWVVEPGEFRIMIGSSSKDIRLRDYLTVVESTL